MRSLLLRRSEAVRPRKTFNMDRLTFISLFNGQWSMVNEIGNAHRRGQGSEDAR